MKTPCFCTNMRLATRKLSAIYDAALAPLGINIAQFHLLRTIRRLGPVSLTELGRVVELERSTTGRNVRVLENMGLAETGRHEADQREARVSLTRGGHDLMREAEPLWESCQDSFVLRLGREKVEALSSLLDSI